MVHKMHLLKVHLMLAFKLCGDRTYSHGQTQRAGRFDEEKGVRRGSELSFEHGCFEPFYTVLYNRGFRLAV